MALGDHGGQQRGQRWRRIQNDALPPEQWEAFVRGWARSLLANVDGAIYICMSTKEWPLVSRVQYIGCAVLLTSSGRTVLPWGTELVP